MAVVDYSYQTNLCKTVLKVVARLDQLVEVGGDCGSISGGTDGRTKIVEDNEYDILWLLRVGGGRNEQGDHTE